MTTAIDLCPVMLFSGKGGVGKTTLAAATAVRLAGQGSRVLLLSTDPAHNLSDVLQVQLGAEPRPVLAGLEAMEVDAQSMFGELLESVDSSGLGALVKMASETPGVDEFGAIEVLLRVLAEARHDVVVVDTAPTGHTLRLLMVPQLLDGWFGTLLSLRHRLAKAGRLFRRLLPGTKTPDGAQLEQELTGGRAVITRLRDHLVDPDQSQIILVTIPEPMSVLETTRTMKMLETNGIPVASLVVNQLQPASADCVHCRRRRALHEAELANLRRLAPAVQTRVVEALPQEIHGGQALAQMGEILWSDAALLGSEPTP